MSYHELNLEERIAIRVGLVQKLSLRETGILNPEPVIKMRDNYLSGDSADITKLWYLLVFMLWWEGWM